MVNSAKVMTSKRWQLSVSIWFGLSLTAMVLTGCGSEPEKTKAVVIRPVLSEVVKPGTSSGLAFTGVVQAAQRADLAFRINGRLTDIRVNEGDIVKAGQLIASLDAKDAELALKAAQLELNNTRAEYERGKALFDQSQAISKSDLDKLSTRYQLAENRVSEATQQLDYTHLHAPFDGIIAQRMVDNHVQVQANETLFMLHDLDNLEVVIQVPDHIMTDKHGNQRAVAELSVFPNYQFDLSVKSYATHADPATQTYAVTLSFNDLDGKAILPGMTARVLPAPGEQHGQSKVLVPLSAVSPDNLGQQYVWVINDKNRVEQRFVETGELYGDRIAVIQHLMPGEIIAIAGTTSLVAEMEVRPTQEESTQEKK
ncbi:efflux RND transporter periplasmic adaptor subunit [Corallincola spongiicola]|uniref:efflux RND transporter periplasmic adaptor subunit n=1 Tax=Corallincola spongiicola TaxID=2520508 RepID=UPI001FE7FB61|nr:efflux RND transporter periplasmic adaptor subunit [Corallincola spongiicola]